MTRYLSVMYWCEHKLGFGRLCANHTHDLIDTSAQQATVLLPATWYSDGDHHYCPTHAAAHRPQPEPRRPQRPAAGQRTLDQAGAP